MKIYSIRKREVAHITSDCAGATLITQPNQAVANPDVNVRFFEVIYFLTEEVKMKKIISILVLVTTIVACGSGAENDPAESVGNITGIVTSSNNGAVIPGVSVTISSKVSNTGSDGVYSLNDIVEGEISITAMKSGFESYNKTINITNDQTVTHDILLTKITTDPLDEIISVFDTGSLDEWDVTLASKSNPSDGKCGSFEGTVGYLCSVPGGEGKTSYFVAPEKFTGDISEYKTLNFDIWRKGGNYFETGYSSYGDIVIKNESKTAIIIFNSDTRPIDAWKSYSIEFDSNSWVLVGATSIGEILSNITSFEIRAEFATGTDYAGLDNFSLSK